MSFPFFPCAKDIAVLTFSLLAKIAHLYLGSILNFFPSCWTSENATPEEYCIQNIRRKLCESGQLRIL